MSHDYKALLDDPLKGEPKKGALSGVRVVKFTVQDRQYALAYAFHSERNVIETLDVGVYENFYRGLERLPARTLKQKDGETLWPLDVRVV
jgi:hypothetical protein